MLQIISGKFFKSNERHSFDGKGILYSNYSWVDKINTCIGSLEPVDYYHEVCSHVLLYVNQIEKDPPDKRISSLVRTGDTEILEQFLLIATFGLRAYFSPFRDEVSQMCRQNPSGGTDTYTPSQFINRFFQTGIRGNENEVNEFVEFVRIVTGLKRDEYKSVISSLKTFRDALLASNYNLDLSYSMLIYCLESLAQGYDNYEVKWEDFEQSGNIDEILNTIEEQSSVTKIRNALLGSTNLRLRKRFNEFILKYIDDSFYIGEASTTNNPIRRSQIERALKNAYNMRSKYVHQLIPILHQLRVPAIARGDIFTWEKEPYLTISGLFRLVIHVINNFIKKSEYIEKEDFNWRKDLPGIIQMNLAPQYWIWQTEGFKPEDVNKRFSGFIQQVYGALTKNDPLTDIRPLLEVFENTISHVNQNQKRVMLSIYWIYNSLVNKDGQRPNWESIIQKHSKELSTCSVETMIVRIILSEQLPWEFDECINSLKIYNKERFWKNTIELPVMIEISLFVTIANYALQEKRSEDRIWLLDFAIFEACGNTQIQKYIIEKRDKSEEVDVSIILGTNKNT